MTRTDRWGTGILLAVATGLALVAVVSLTPATTPTYAEDAPAGQAVFMAQKCNTCHSVQAAGIEAKMKGKMAGPDLSKVTQERDAEWITGYLHKEVDLDGKKHGKQFTGSDEELKALIDWLKEMAAK
jgi:mono/diheme cytochrome c family protein